MISKLQPVLLLAELKVYSVNYGVCLKVYSRYLPDPLCGIFGLDSGYIAHDIPFIWAKSSLNCDAYLSASKP